MDIILESKLIDLSWYFSFFACRRNIFFSSKIIKDTMCNKLFMEFIAEIDTNRQVDTIDEIADQLVLYAT